MDKRLEEIEKLIEKFPDFPQPGILFRDIFPVLRNPKAFQDLIDLLTEHIRKNCKGAEIIVGLESRGFLFGPNIAQNLNVAFVPIRKKGKLPGETYSVTYSLEYGEDTMEVQKAAIKPGQKVVIIDDLLATGGTLSAAVSLIEMAKGEIIDCVVVMELSALHGREKVKSSLTSFLKY